jgi:hypothetical protein
MEEMMALRGASAWIFLGGIYACRRNRESPEPLAKAPILLAMMLQFTRTIA